MNPVSNPSPSSGIATGGARAKTDRYAKTAGKLEAVFVQQMFKAMRESVSRGDGALDESGGEEMFTSLFDQAVADRAPEQLHSSLSAAIVTAMKHRDGSHAAPAERR